MASTVWLITGCSSGFGFQLCLVALKAGHKVIATSRNPSKDSDLVQQIKKLGGIWLALDVNSGEAEINQLVEMSCKIHGKIDILVNNAAVGILGAMEDMRHGYERLFSTFQHTDYSVVAKKPEL
ncbi:hypothetical protein EAF04_001200 [Stromatinia cepivora]|nr:hypothetical protein EAF04_001200 [Stromatinia cepivora]